MDSQGNWQGDAEVWCRSFLSREFRLLCAKCSEEGLHQPKNLPRALLRIVDVLVRCRRATVDTSNTTIDRHDDHMVDYMDGNIPSSVSAGNATLSIEYIELHIVGQIRYP